MPIYIDILENKVLGREYKRGREEGRKEGELDFLRKLLEKRFGPIPAWAEERLASRTRPEIEELALRMLDTTSLEELLDPTS